MVVTYFPPPDINARVQLILAQVDRLVIVDNASGESAVSGLRDLCAESGAELISNAANLGIAAALNAGFDLLAPTGVDWILTMDQDSTIHPGCVAALTHLASDDVALVGANREDRHNHVSQRWLRPSPGLRGFERVECECIDAGGVSLVISSGTLTSLRAYRELGPFREDFFVDMVDFEYCLRARRAGYRILVACDARMTHRVGHKTVAHAGGITLSATHHPPSRRYYLFRNAVVTMREYSAAFPHWAMYQLLALAEVAAGIVLLESHKISKLRACVRGVTDGMKGRLGPAPPDLRR